MNIKAHEIAFDFDGVVADTFRLFVEIARRDHRIEMAYEDITSYEFLKVIDMNGDVASLIIGTLNDRPHELDLRPNTGAEEVLARIAHTAPPLSVVTARTIGEPVRLWFEKNIPAIPLSRIRVDATGESTAKLQILRSHGIRYFVEDRLDTCHMLAEEGITPILFDQPWNREDHPFTVVTCWDDIASLISWSA